MGRSVTLIGIQWELCLARSLVWYPLLLWQGVVISSKSEFRKPSTDRLWRYSASVSVTWKWLLVDHWLVNDLLVHCWLRVRHRLLNRGLVSRRLIGP